MKPGQKPTPKDLQQEKDGKVENNQTAEGKLPPAKVGELLEKLLTADQWGLLPKKLQEEVRNSSGKEFPVEYREIISKYYKKMAELMKK